MRPQIMLTFGISYDANHEEVGMLKDAIDKAFGSRDKLELKPDNIKPNAPDNGAGRAPDEAPAAAPQEPATQEPPVGGNTVRDSAGVPWDSRIHSTPATAKADGTWRARRGVDPGTAARVTAELLSTVNAPAGYSVVLDGDARVTGVVPVPPPVAAPAPPAPAPVAAPAPPPAPTVDPAYTAFVQYIASITLSADNPTGRVDADWVKGVLTNYGVANGEMQNLLHRIDLIGPIHAAIVAALA